jgi:MscS family membrane protein
MDTSLLRIILQIPIEEYLDGVFFGNSLKQYLIFFGILGGSIIAGRILYYIFKIYVRRLTRKTKSNVDDILVDKIEEPLVAFVVILGFYFAYEQLNLSEYNYEIFSRITKNLFTIVFAWFLIRFLDALASNYAQPAGPSAEGLRTHVISLSRLITKYSLMALTVIIVISNFGYNVTSLIASLGIGGLAVALAAQEILKNILGGFVIMFDQPFRIGEWVVINETEGVVQEIGLRSTRVKTFRGEFITIPNHYITESMICNFNKYPDTRETIVLVLDRNLSVEQLDTAKGIIIEALRNTKQVVKNSHELNFIGYNEYGIELFIGYNIEIETPAQKRKIRDEAFTQIKKKFDEEGIIVAVPVRVLDFKGVKQINLNGQLDVPKNEN